MGQPDPGHESDGRAERAIGLVVAAEIRRVPGEQDRQDDPGERSERTAPGDPTPFGRVAARPISGR